MMRTEKKKKKELDIAFGKTRKSNCAASTSDETEREQIQDTKPKEGKE